MVKGEVDFYVGITHAVSGLSDLSTGARRVRQRLGVLQPVPHLQEPYSTCRCQRRSSALYTSSPSRIGSREAASKSRQSGTEAQTGLSSVMFAP
eukprot:31772-Pleurochrysis_carterae.AAC.3